MPDHERAIERQIDVPGTPEVVWRAIATGPGITSWYVPHTVEEHTGGALSASFGPGPDLQIAGRVAAWEPPHRVVFDKGDGVPGLAFEWTVEARDGGGCVVRLVNTGFGTGEDWDAQYDGMAEGWTLFLANLRLHLTHFAGRTATPILPTAGWPGPRAEAWAALTDALGLPATPEAGQRVATTATDAPRLAGTVAEAAPSWLTLVLDEPAPGTAILAAEGSGPSAAVSVWSYLYGDEGAVAAARDEPRWRSWLDARGGGPG
jgi:uncharacterized protein YndB with AHSA1/START domain